MAKLLKDYRGIKKKTIYDVAEFVGVSHTYISQIENGKKLPSKNIFFLLTFYLSDFNEISYSEQNLKQTLKRIDDELGEQEAKSLKDEYDRVDKLLKLYSHYRNLDKIKLEEEYFLYVGKMIAEELKESNELLTARIHNKILLNRNTGSSEIIKEPFLDLKWLLNQKEFYVFYGNEFDTQKLSEKYDDADTLYYNILNDDDLNIINSIIEAYISNKYKKIN